MKSYEIDLVELKKKILSLDINDKLRSRLVQEYNDNLYEIIPFIKKPLPQECEIDDTLILKDYIRFKENFKAKGYFDIKKYIRIVDLIAEIRVKKIRSWGGKVHAELIELFKGEAPPNFIIDVIKSWKPDNWFRKNENCLVYLSCKIPGKYLASSIKSKMDITIENKIKYIFSYNCEPEFWGKIKTTEIPTTEWEYLTKVLYSDVVQILHNTT